MNHTKSHQIIKNENHSIIDLEKIHRDATEGQNMPDKESIYISNVIDRKGREREKRTYTH